MCLVCNRGYIEDERHFLIYCPGYDNIRNELHCLLSTHDVVFKSLNDEDKIEYLPTLENETTSKIVVKYTYLMFQKRKDILLFFLLQDKGHYQQKSKTQHLQYH